MRLPQLKLNQKLAAVALALGALALFALPHTYNAHLILVSINFLMAVPAEL